MTATAPPRDELLLGLSQRPLDDLLAEAAVRRDELFGTRVTYSPKVFIPLTQLCRDTCGYCTFAHAPSRLDNAFLAPSQVVEIAAAGAMAGCHEALFTLGERPEARYAEARDWLRHHGYESTVEYLARRAALVRAGDRAAAARQRRRALPVTTCRRLREVSVSQGMMLESLNPTWRRAPGRPDKTPARRLATLEAAGELAIPFTTGISGRHR